MLCYVMLCYVYNFAQTAKTLISWGFAGQKYDKYNTSHGLALLFYKDASTIGVNIYFGCSKELSH